MTVPAELQVDLLRRVVRFERGFAARAKGRIKLVLVVRAGSAASERVAGQVSAALESTKEIGGVPLAVSTMRLTTPAALRKKIEAEGAQIVYLLPGLEGEVPAIAAALAGLPVISVAADGDQVDQGAVLGFELVSARPKIALNLGQAKLQGLDWNSELFRLARVVK